MGRPCLINFALFLTQQASSPWETRGGRFKSCRVQGPLTTYPEGYQYCHGRRKGCGQSYGQMVMEKHGPVCSSPCNASTATTASPADESQHKQRMFAQREYHTARTAGSCRPRGIDCTTTRCVPCRRSTSHTEPDQRGAVGGRASRAGACNLEPNQQAPAFTHARATQQSA